jgi:hypothetical protein
LSSTNKSRNRSEMVLLLSCAFLFAGWGIMHLMGEVPYRNFFWSESLFKPVLWLFTSAPWDDYAVSSWHEKTLNLAITSIGVVQITISLVCVWLLVGKQQFAFHRSLLFSGGVSIFLLALLLFKESGYQIAMLLEYSGQVAAPFLLIYYDRLRRESWQLTFKIAIAFTFAFHGFYAIGYYPVPGSFIDMVITTMGFSEEQARLFLMFAGVLDIALAIALFVPRLAQVALAYAVMWGLLTTMARPVSYLSLQVGLENIVFWMGQAFLRAPHFGLPLALYLMNYYENKVLMPAKLSVFRSRSELLSLQVKKNPDLSIGECVSSPLLGKAIDREGASNHHPSFRKRRLGVLRRSRRPLDF